MNPNETHDAIIVVDALLLQDAVEEATADGIAGATDLAHDLS